MKKQEFPSYNKMYLDFFCNIFEKQNFVSNVTSVISNKDDVTERLIGICFMSKHRGYFQTTAVLNMEMKLTVEMRKVDSKSEES